MSLKTDLELLLKQAGRRQMTPAEQHAQAPVLGDRADDAFRIQRRPGRKPKSLPMGHGTEPRRTRRRAQAENAQLRIALHDAIRRPLGVTPDSALGILTTRADGDEAETRRAGGARL